MRNYDHVPNGVGTRKPADETQVALDDLRVQLGTITATVARLERRSHERQWLSRSRDAAIIAAASAICGVLGLVLLGRF
jgi:hypothetical protein